jgi:uncharacterized protein (DUF2336 family)
VNLIGGGSNPSSRAWGKGVIIEAFLRWAETAKVGDRARAANALGRAFLQSTMPVAERASAEMAMIHLLDDPSPRVRLSLAEALAHSRDAPRNIVLSLAEDQAEIAGEVIISSPIFTDGDLVDLVQRGGGLTRLLVASRGEVSAVVSSALVEAGEEEEILCLLQNEGAALSGSSLKRIVERFGHLPEVRSQLCERASLPADARHVLVRQVSDALSNFSLAQATVGTGRLNRVTREATDAATITIAGETPQEDLSGLVEHLRLSGCLTPAFLMHALCSGKVDFFAGAIVSLSGCDERRVRAILATGRMHAVRALYECAGLKRDVSAIFVDATLLWRKASRGAVGKKSENISLRLLRTFMRDRASSGAAQELLDMVEKLHLAEQRRMARDFASLATPSAA